MLTHRRLGLSVVAEAHVAVVLAAEDDINSVSFGRSLLLGHIGLEHHEILA